MQAKDADAMAKMMKSLQAFHGDKSKATAKDFRTYCLGSKRLGKAWIACVDSKPVGFATVSDWISFVHIQPTRMLDLLYVEDNFRGGGVGSALIAMVAKDALKHNFLCLRTGAARTNLRAQALYRRLGFQEIKHPSVKYKIEGIRLKNLAEPH